MRTKQTDREKLVERELKRVRAFDESRMLPEVVPFVRLYRKELERELDALRRE